MSPAAEPKVPKKSPATLADGNSKTELKTSNIDVLGVTYTIKVRRTTTITKQSESPEMALKIGKITDAEQPAGIVAKRGFILGTVPTLVDRGFFITI